MYGHTYSPIYSASGTEYLEAVSYADLAFNDYNLQNGSINVTGHDFESPGIIQYISKDRGLSHGAVFIDKKSRLRSMTVVGYLIGSSREAVELLADEFKGEIDQTQGILRFKTRGSSYRQILATVTSVDMKRLAYHVTKIPFSITFTANDPFWTDVSGISKTLSSLTAASYIDTIDNPGSADMAVRAYLFFKTGNTGVTTVSFSNNNRTIILSAAFVDSDVIYFDFENKRVYLNGVKMEYDGTFPEFPRGDNTFTVSIDGSTRLYNLLLLNTYKYK